MRTYYLPLAVAVDGHASVLAMTAEIVMIDEHDRTLIQPNRGTIRFLSEGETLHETEAAALADGAAILRRTAAAALAKADEIEAGLAATKPEVIS